MRSVPNPQTDPRTARWSLTPYNLPSFSAESLPHVLRSLLEYGLFFLATALGVQVLVLSGGMWGSQTWSVVSLWYNSLTQSQSQYTDISNMMSMYCIYVFLLCLRGPCPSDISYQIVD